MTGRKVVYMSADKAKENRIRKQLRKMGYALKSRTIPIAIIGGHRVLDTKYTVVDANNVIVAGEFVMSLDEIEKAWL